MGAETEVRATHTLAFGASAADKPSLLQHSECMNNSEFPAGLRILVVDDDPICLLILDRMLRQCLYKVTTCERAIEALQILRENKDGFDLVISDVHMPDMDGFKLLELVGLEMDLPVIMMSANGETSAVMKGIKHGACDYLLKPVRIEELKNIWQHVVRRKKRAPDALDSYDERHRQDDISDFHASDGFEGTLKPSKKRKDAKEEEEDTELENDDPSTSKKPRVVWSVELHQKFVTAVNQLGLDKAVPKRILELMDVHRLTRENVASHLQKYRLYLKRLSGAAHQAGGLGAAAFMGVTDATFGGSRGGLVDLQAQAFVSALQAGLYDRMGPGVVATDPFSPRQIGTINNDVGARSSYGPTVNRSIASSALDFKHLGQGAGHFMPFGQVDKGLTGFSALHELSGVSGMGTLGQGALDSTFQSGSASSPSMLQHQANIMPNMTSMGGQLGADLGAKLSSFDATSHLRLGQEKSSLSSPRFTPSTGPSWRALPVDTRSYTNPLAAITSISHGSDAGVTLVTKECTARPGKLLSSNTAQGGSYNSLTLASRSVSNARPNTWQGWHGFEASPNARQRVGGGLIMNSEYHRGLTDQPEEKGIGWIAGLQDSVGLDSNGLFKPLYTAIPSFGSGEQCTGVEAEYKSKESGGADHLLGSKAENAIILDAVPSEDLLTSYFKHS